MIKGKYLLNKWWFLTNFLKPLIEKYGFNISQHITSQHNCYPTIPSGSQNISQNYQ